MPFNLIFTGEVMQADIHPKYEKMHVKCTNCGNEFETRSTMCTAEYKVDLCIECHPITTGIQNVKRAGQVERFYNKFGMKGEESK